MTLLCNAFDACLRVRLRLCIRCVDWRISQCISGFLSANQWSFAPIDHLSDETEHWVQSKAENNIRQLSVSVERCLSTAANELLLSHAITTTIKTFEFCKIPMNWKLGTMSCAQPIGHWHCQRTTHQPLPVSHSGLCVSHELWIT